MIPVTTDRERASTEHAWTDLITNFTHLENVHLEDNLDNYIQAGQAPPELTMSCLHEFTHHWCFHSVLGSTLVALKYRIVREILVNPEARKHEM